MREGNRKVAERYRTAEWQKTAGSALDSAVQKRYEERNRVAEEVNTATREKNEVAVEINALRTKLVADEKTALAEQKGKYKKLLEELQVQSELLSGAAESDVAKARETLVKATTKADELQKKYAEMAVKQSLVPHEPVKFAVSEVVKGKMMSREGEIAPYDNRFGPKESLEEAVNDLLVHRAEAGLAVDVVREFEEKLIIGETELATNEKILEETISWVDAEIDRLKAEELTALTQKRDEVLELGARARGAWIGKKGKADDAARARSELGKMRTAIAEKLNGIRSAASERTVKIVESRQDVRRDDETGLRRWLANHKAVLTPAEQSEMAGNIDRYAALLKPEKDIYDKRQQYHHVTIEKKLAEVGGLAGI